MMYTGQENEVREGFIVYRGPVPRIHMPDQRGDAGSSGSVELRMETIVPQQSDRERIWEIALDVLGAGLFALLALIPVIAIT